MKKIFNYKQKSEFFVIYKIVEKKIFHRKKWQRKWLSIAAIALKVFHRKKTAGLRMRSSLFGLQTTSLTPAASTFSVIN